MGKTYDIPQIEICLKGGVVQSVEIPEGTNIRVRLKDYDVDIDPNSKEAEGYEIKEDEDGVYEEGIWES